MVLSDENVESLMFWSLGKNFIFTIKNNIKKFPSTHHQENVKRKVKNMAHNQDFEITKLSTPKTMPH